jgi:hypothetical protein
VEEMRIEVQHDADITMTKLMLDVFYIGPMLIEETGENN